MQSRTDLIYLQDRKIAELTEQKERLIADLQLDSDTVGIIDYCRIVDYCRIR